MCRSCKPYCCIEMRNGSIFLLVVPTASEIQTFSNRCRITFYKIWWLLANFFKTFKMDWVCRETLGLNLNLMQKYLKWAKLWSFIRNPSAQVGYSVPDNCCNMENYISFLEISWKIILPSLKFRFASLYRTRHRAMPECTWDLFNEGVSTLWKNDSSAVYTAWSRSPAPIARGNAIHM